MPLSTVASLSITDLTNKVWFVSGLSIARSLLTVDVAMNGS